MIIIENPIYISFCPSEKDLLAQFRLGILPLNLKTGRYKLNEEKGKFSRTKPEERLCLVCNSGLTEDESHFLLECTYYSQIRQKLIQIAFIKK